MDSNTRDAQGNPISSTGTSLNVNVTDFPVTQPISGTVAVSNFPTIQPVSATALPLPANAAQETGGNLALIASYELYNQQIVDLLKRINAAIEVNNMLLASAFGANHINTDDVMEMIQ